MPLFTFTGSQGQMIAQLSVFGWILVIIGSWKLNIHSKSGLCNRVLSDDSLQLSFAILCDNSRILHLNWFWVEQTDKNRKLNVFENHFAPLPIRKMNFSEFPLYSRRFLCRLTAIHLSMWKLELVLLSYCII